MVSAHGLVWLVGRSTTVAIFFMGVTVIRHAHLCHRFTATVAVILDVASGFDRHFNCLLYTSRNNCFDLIRHFAAYLVLFSHHFRLSGFEEPVIPGWDTFGFVAVAIFFSISGYFMPRSYSNSSGFISFMAKRCRRVFPGLFICSFIMVYILGFIFSDDKNIHYFFSYQNLKYFFYSATLKLYTVQFPDFIFSYSINGSLWTLPIEFFCYLIIGCILTCHFGKESILLLLLLSCVSTELFLKNIWTDFYIYEVSMKYLSIFGVAFSTGALMSMTTDKWKNRKYLLVIPSIILTFLLLGHLEIFIFGTACITIITVIIGSSFREKIINGRYDISYGIYIYAFPIQQIVINKITTNFWFGMILSTILTTIAGWLSYKYIESPFLSKYRELHPAPKI